MLFSFFLQLPSLPSDSRLRRTQSDEEFLPSGMANLEMQVTVGVDARRTDGRTGEI